MGTSAISVTISKNRVAQPFEESECEDFLYSLYDLASPCIAKRLKHLVGGGSNLPDRESLVLWRQVSRSSILALLDCLISYPSSTRLDLNARDWLNRCLGMVDFEKFQIETSLQQDDARIALEEATLVVVEHLQTPRRIFYKGFLADTDSQAVR